MFAGHFTQFPPNQAYYPAESFKLPAASSASLQFEYNAEEKKRKLDRACDQCRRRKTRCDGMKSPTHVCTNCIQNRKACTYMESSKPRGPSKAYVTGLEDRMELLEAMLRKIRPGVDFSSELSPPVVRDSWKHDSPEKNRASPSGSSDQAKYNKLEHSNFAGKGQSDKPCETMDFPSTLEHARTYLSATSMHLEGPDDGSDDSFSSDIEVMSPEGDIVPLTLEGLESTANGLEWDPEHRYHGKSSFIHGAISAQAAKWHHYAGNKSQHPHGGLRGMHVRPEYWRLQRWELDWDSNASTTLHTSALALFPPPDLAQRLLSLYFEHSNSFYPLLHRPTFMRQWTDGLHLRDVWFAAVCMGIFAVASRWCDDPRVLVGDFPAGEPAEKEGHRAGWVYIRASISVHRARSTVIRPACLFEVQTLVLMVLFLRGTQYAPVCWYFTGIGLRKIQDLGAHQAKVYSTKPTVQGELWKRCFWLFVALDRIVSTCTGRPCCIGEDEYDIDLPREVDDEYWINENPELAFRQPEGKPSFVTGFNLWLKLTQMTAVVLRTLYVPDKSKVFLGIKKEMVIKNLNRAMSEWMDSVPAHLRWTPGMTDPVFSDQAATLLATYNHLQTVLYSPFTNLPISTKKLKKDSNDEQKGQDDSFRPSSVCVDAARSCARIINHQMCRGCFNAPSLIQSSSSCAAVLVSYIWNLKAKQKAGAVSGSDATSLQSAIDELMADVEVLMRALEMAAVTWALASGLLKDLRISLPGPNDGNPDDVTVDQAAEAHPQPPQRTHEAWLWGISSDKGTPDVDEITQLVAAAPTSESSPRPDPSAAAENDDEWARSAGRAQMYCPTSLFELTQPTLLDSRADPRALTYPGATPMVPHEWTDAGNTQRWDVFAYGGGLEFSESAQMQDIFCRAMLAGAYCNM